MRKRRTESEPSTVPTAAEYEAALSAELKARAPGWELSRLSRLGYREIVDVHLPEGEPMNIIQRDVERWSKP